MAGAVVYKDLPYCGQTKHCSCDNGDGINKHCLDLFLPDDLSRPNAKPPLVFFIHGGGWRRGHKNGWKHYLSSYDTNLFIYLVLKLFGVYNNVGRAFSKAGYACVVPSYRLAWTPLYVFAFELFVSLFLTLATIFPFSTGIYLLCSATVTSGHMPVDLQWGTESGGRLLPVYGVLSCSTFVLWIIITLRYHVYGKTLPCFLWSCLPILAMVIHTNSGGIHLGMLGNPYIFLFLITLTYMSLLLNYYQRHGLRRNRFKDSLLDINEALQWSIQYGKSSGLYDTECIYLSGHSAGAHLGMMTLLDQVADCNLNTAIKGFIGISGAYDITQMTDWLPRQLYIKPAFGPRKGMSWETSSPLLLLPKPASKTGCCHSLRAPIPPCLLLTAVSDFGLGAQAETLRNVLKELGCVANHRTLKNHNHFSIISLFGQSILGNLWTRVFLKSRQDPWEMCVSFIKEIQGPTIT